MFMPDCAVPRRLNTDGTALSMQVTLDRRNKEWIDNMGEVRCYLKPVHNSQGKNVIILPLCEEFVFKYNLTVCPFFAIFFTHLMVMYFITGAVHALMCSRCVSVRNLP